MKRPTIADGQEFGRRQPDLAEQTPAWKKSMIAVRTIQNEKVIR